MSREDGHEPCHYGSGGERPRRPADSRNNAGRQALSSGDHRPGQGFAQDQAFADDARDMASRARGSAQWIDFAASPIA